MRNTKVLVYICFFLFGLLFYVTAFAIGSSQPTAGAILTNIGTVVISLALVDLLWGVSGGEPLSNQIRELKGISVLNSDAEKTGLARVFEKPATTERTEWLSLAKLAKRQIDICNWTAYSLADSVEWLAVLKERATAGVKVRILIYEISNPTIDHFLKDSPSLSAIKTQMGRAWDVFSNLHEEIVPEARANLQVARVYTGAITCSIRRFDGSLYFLPYFSQLPTRSSPVFLTVGPDKPIFLTYMQEFDALFSKAQTVELDRPESTDQVAG